MSAQNSSFAEKLSFYRKRSGLLQKSLAEQLGVSTSAISNWENGINFPRLDTVYKICSILNVSVAQLLGINDSILNQEDQALIVAYRNSPSMQQAVQRLLGMEKNNS